MKTNLKLLLISLLITVGCAPSYMSTAPVYEDDIYYTPGAAPLVVQEVTPQEVPTRAATVEAPQQAPLYQPADEGTAATKTEPNSSISLDNRDFTPFQERYAELLANDSIQTLDTIVYQNEETGYYIGGFKGDEADLADAERLRMFYPQGFGYFYGNGYNTAMMLAGDSDWNVFVEGNYVWWTPTWTNTYFYNDYRFHPNRYGRLFAYGLELGIRNYSSFYYGSSRSWTYPMWNMYFDWYSPGYSMYGYYGSYRHDPFYYGFGFGYGYGYGGYYHDYYGYPYYGHHKPHHGHYYNNRYTSRRSSGSKSLHYNRSQNKSGVVYSTRQSANTGSTKSTISRYSSRKSSPASRYNSRSTKSRYSTGRVNYQPRNSYIRNSGTKSQPANNRGTRYNSRSNYNTRGSYTTPRRNNVPSYSTPRTSTRPTYNKTGTNKGSSYNSRYTRPNTKSYGTRGSSGYSKVKSKATYQKGSSKSSGSSYRKGSSNSGNRSNGSSYRSRSSSSSYRSSGSSSRSSSSSSSTRSSSTRSSGSSSGSYKRR